MYPIESFLHNLCQFLKTGSISDKEVPFLKIALERIPFFAVPIYKKQLNRIYRLSINNKIFRGENKRIEELKYLRNPNKLIVEKMGRANLVNQSVLYGGFQPLTLLNELKPNVGDLITLTEWKLNTNNYLNITSIFKQEDEHYGNELSLKFQIEYINSAKRQLVQSEIDQREILLNFLSNCFAKPVSELHTDYYLSSYFADYIFNKFENGIIDTLLYPSVQEDGSFMNIAMDSDVFKNNYVVKEIKESIVIFADHEKRQYQMSGTGITRNLNGEQIIWN